MTGFCRYCGRKLINPGRLSIRNSYNYKMLYEKENEIRERYNKQLCAKCDKELKMSENPSKRTNEEEQP
jgi:hypothetical protein